MLKKSIGLLIIFIASISCVNINKTYAKTSATNGDSIFSNARNFLNEGREDAQESLNQENLRNTSNFLYNILFAIAIVIAVAIGLILGIKLMISSAEEQAKIKELLIPYVVGCIVVFGAIGIWKLAISVFSKL